MTATRTDTPAMPTRTAASLPKKYLNTREAAAYLGRSVDTLNRWRSYQTGPEYFRQRGKIYYSLEGLDKWVEGK